MIKMKYGECLICEKTKAIAISRIVQKKFNLGIGMSSFSITNICIDCFGRIQAGKENLDEVFKDKLQNKLFKLLEEEVLTIDVIKKSLGIGDRYFITLIKQIKPIEGYKYIKEDIIKAYMGRDFIVGDM